MRRMMLGGLAALSPAVAEAQTIPMAEVEHRDAMALVERLLPADIRGKVVEGSVRRQFLPGNVFWAGYRTKPRPIGPDLCAQTLYSLQLSGNTPPSAPPHSGTELTIGAVESKELQAIAFPEVEADAASCAHTQGFVDLSGVDGARKAAAYRLLLRMMRDARAAEPLPFGLTCEPIEKSACNDARASLANLPLEALAGIEVSSGKKDVLSESGGVRVLQQRPIEPGQPYQVTIAFGMSGNDGDSWRVRWRHEHGGPSTLLLTRSTIIYH